MKTQQVLTATVTLLTAAILFASCSSYEAIGKVPMLSASVVDTTATYRLITAASGASGSEIRKNSAESVADAVQKLINNVPGGAFVTNVNVYVLNNGNYAVSGDVWGVAPVTHKADTLHYAAGTRPAKVTHRNVMASIK